MLIKKFSSNAIEFDNGWTLQGSEKFSQPLGLSFKDLVGQSIDLSSDDFFYVAHERNLVLLISGKEVIFAPQKYLVINLKNTKKRYDLS